MRRKYAILKLSVMLCFLQTQAQFSEKHNLVFNNAAYDVFTLKADSLLAAKLIVKNNTALLSEADFFNSIADSTFFAITASIVDSGCRTLGLYIEQGNKLKDLNLSQGSGNFFLKPGVIAVDKNKVIIVESAAFNDSASYAIQSGPMLIINNVINAAFDKNSKNRNIRCGVGVYVEKNEAYVVFIKSLVPVTFYEFSKLFQEKYNCSNALCLESGGNCSMHLPTRAAAYSNTLKVCRYLFIAL